MRQRRGCARLCRRSRARHCARASPAAEGEPNVTSRHRRRRSSVAPRPTPRRSTHRSSMVRNLLMYVAICVIAIAFIWLAARLIGLSRPSRGPTGHPWLDAEDAFDHARREHRRHRVAAVLHGEPHRLDMPIMSGVAALAARGSTPSSRSRYGTSSARRVPATASSTVTSCRPMSEAVVASRHSSSRAARGRRFPPSTSTGCTVATGSPTATTGWRSPGRSAKSPSRRTSPTSPDGDRHLDVAAIHTTRRRLPRALSAACAVLVVVVPPLVRWSTASACASLPGHPEPRRGASPRSAARGVQLATPRARRSAAGSSDASSFWRGRCGRSLGRCPPAKQITNSAHRDDSRFVVHGCRRARRIR